MEIRGGPWSCTLRAWRPGYAGLAVTWKSENERAT